MANKLSRSSERRGSLARNVSRRLGLSLNGPLPGYWLRRLISTPAVFSAWDFSVFSCSLFGSIAVTNKEGAELVWCEGLGLRHPSCGVHAEFMRSSCGVHAEFMRSSCGSSCGVHAEFMRSSCGVHAEFMRSSCGVHAEFMRSSCGVHAEFMRGFMRSSCGVHAEFMRSSCGMISQV